MNINSLIMIRINKILYLSLFIIFSLELVAQHVGIGTPTPAPDATLHVAGKIRVDDLQSFGHPKKVYTDSTGLLMNNGKSKRLYINPSQFSTQDQLAVINGNLARSNDNVGALSMYAPVALPDYSAIVGFEVVVLDNSTNSDLAVRLYMADGSSANAPTPISTLTTNGDLPTSQRLSDASGNWAVKVLNEFNTFFVRFNPISGGNWDNGNLRTYSIIIHYIEY